MSWFYEPDFSDDYKRLYELENELSDVKPDRFELLSIWRLARDDEYAKWAKEVGPDTCQITFFGMEDTNDWFYRRRGAFQDNIVATERLLDAGMKPRWQIFLTKRIVPEIGQILKLIDQLRLRDRVRSLGEDFDFFIHLPDSDGEAINIEHLRPSLEDTRLIPQEMIDSSKRYLNKEELWYTEGELISGIVTGEDAFPYAYSYPKTLCFYIKSNWDVFSNMGALEPWWRLGNLKTDSLQSIFDDFEGNRVLGLETIFTVSAKELAKRFGDPKSHLVFASKHDLLKLFVLRYCEQVYINDKSC